jgi:bifunctional non-homologous end joining protein LigD
MPDKPRLERYRDMRDFDRTPEPAGGSPWAGGTGPRFVVQRHRARRLHYDLRFEIDGVLVSWAVPKGPTLDPAARRNAVHVEDHPVEYMDFEGVIPARQYGGGDVIVWDAGTWEPHGTDDPAAAVAAGELHAEVRGQKLRGRLVLVRRERADGGKEQWLLLHKRDEHAVEGWDPEDHPRSVLTGRTNEEVAADPDRLWRSDLPAAEASVALRPPPVAPASEEELAALDALGAGGTWDVFGRRIRVRDLDEVVVRGRSGGRPVTRRELVGYAARVAPAVLPYVRGRGVALHRSAHGADDRLVRQRRLPTRVPAWLPRAEVAEASGRTITALAPDDPAALVWAVAAAGAVEWHMWTSTTDALDVPTLAVVGLRPGPRSRWADLLAVAHLYRSALDHLSVRAGAVVTGDGGLEVRVPVGQGTTFEQARRWVEQLSRAVTGVVPDLVDPDGRDPRRVRLGHTANAVGRTVVVPYSPRAVAGAPVALPLAWEELDDPSLRPGTVTIRTVPDRLTERGDPSRALLSVDQALPRLD